MRSTRSTRSSTSRRAAVAAVLTACLGVATAGAAGAAPAPSPAPTLPSFSTSPTTSPSATPTGPLTVDQMKKALPTNADLSGYTYDPTQDTSTVTSQPDTLTTGGAACQKFLDATEGLSTTYGTLAEVDRTLHATDNTHIAQVSILSFPTPDAANKALTDGKDGISGCTDLAGMIGGTQTTGTLAEIPQLAAATDRLGYVGYLTVGGQQVLVAAETVQVGSAIVDITLVGPQTEDTTILQQIGTTLGTVTNTVTGKLSQAAV